MEALIIDDNNDLVIDVVRDDAGLITGGLCIGDVFRQRQKLLLEADKGDFKEHPLLGVGMIGFINDDSPVVMFREIRNQFKMDCMRINEISLRAGNLSILADEG